MATNFIGKISKIGQPTFSHHTEMDGNIAISNADDEITKISLHCIEMW